MGNDGKKLSILYVLKVMENYSDEDHPLKQQDIIRRIEDDYGCSLERKSVAYSLSLLMEMGYDIEKGPQGGFRLLSRKYERSEISYLIDAVFSSKAIPPNEAKNLADKLSSELSEHQRKSYRYLYKSNQIDRTFLRELFYTIDVISDAIGKGKKISFRYVTYKGTEESEERYNGKTYVVNPYYLANSKGIYYLICNYDKYDCRSIYRLEFIKDAKILDEPIKEMDQVRAFDGFDIARFLNEHQYMVDDEVVEAKVEFSSEWSIHLAVDWFGKNVTNIKRDEDGKATATIRNNVSSIAYWCLQYPENVKALSPKSVLNLTNREVDALTNNYKGGKEQ
jgi:predicted DNA-binding transcriptional regulator YafY